MTRVGNELRFPLRVKVDVFNKNLNMWEDLAEKLEEEGIVHRVRKLRIRHRRMLEDAHGIDGVLVRKNALSWM